MFWKLRAHWKKRGPVDMPFHYQRWTLWRRTDSLCFHFTVLYVLLSYYGESHVREAFATRVHLWRDVSHTRLIFSVPCRLRVSSHPITSSLGDRPSAYLKWARRALKALKALVKLQALVRGHMVRKQTADMLRRMQTLVRVQARARASRTNLLESLHSTSKSSHLSHRVPPTPDINEHQLRARSTKFDGSSILKRCGSNSNFRDIIDLDRVQSGSDWLNRWMEESLWNNSRDNSLRNGRADDEKSDKILEVDTWRPHLKSQQSNRSFQTSQHVFSSDFNRESYMTYNSPTKHSTKAPNPVPPTQATQSSREFLSLSTLTGKDEPAVRTAGNSPQVYSATSRPGSNGRRGPFTPTRSECAWGFFSGYSGYPNYMSNTESSRAKVRSQSAPRQRLDFENFGSIRRSVQGFQDAGINSDGIFSQQVDYMNKAYHASSRFNRLGSSNLK